MFRTYTAAILLLSALAPGCSRDPETRKREYLASGNQYFDQARFSEAVIEYRNAVQIDPRFGEARAKLAQSHAKLGDNGQALEEYVRAADVLPENAEVQLQAGRYLLAAGRADDALGRANAVLNRDPNNVEALVLRGSALGGLKDLDGALADIEEAIRIDPARGATYAQLGILEIARGRRGEAEDALRKTVTLAPDWVPGHLALGHFYWMSGRISEAEAAIRQALVLEPAHQIANRAMAAFVIATGRVAEAEPFLKRVASESRSPAAVFALADYYLGTGRAKDAIAQLQPLVAGDRNIAGAKQRLAQAYAADGNRTEAHVLLDQALAANARDAQALHLKGLLLMEDGRRDEALERIRAAAEIEPSSAAIQFALGKVYAARGDGAGAETAFKHVLALNPRAAAAQMELSKVQLASGSPAESLRSAQGASQLEPSSVEVKLTLARSLLASKDLPGAEEEIRALLIDHPSVAGVHVMNGVLTTLKKDPTSARAAFERAVSLEPTSVDAIAGLVGLDLAARNVAAAKARIDGQLAGGGTPPSGLLLLAARTYAAANDLPGAERFLRRAIEQEPTLLPGYALLGQIYIAQGRMDEARKEFEALADRQSRPVAALTMAGMILQGMGQTELAKERFERALAADPRAAVAANNLAWIRAESSEDLDGALQLAQTAVAAAPNLPEALDTLGWIYYKKNQPDLAIPPLTRSVERDPANPVYHYHLGLAHSQAGDYVRARQSLTRALDLRADFSGADDARKALAAVQPAFR